MYIKYTPFEEGFDPYQYEASELRNTRSFPKSRRNVLAFIYEALGDTPEDAEKRVNEIPDFTIEDGVLLSVLAEEYDIVIPKGVHTIGDGAFQNTFIGSVTMPNSVQVIQKDAFYASYVHEIKLSKNLRYIGTGAFAGCDHLEKIYIPKSVTHIGIWAFRFCSNLKKIYFESDTISPDFHSEWCGGCRAKIIWGA